MRSAAYWWPAARILLVVAFCVSAGAGTISDYELIYRVELPFRGLAPPGGIELKVYPTGIRADSRFFSGYARTGEGDFYLMSRLARLYGKVPIPVVGDILEERLAPDERLGTRSYALSASGQERTIAGLPALHYRIEIGAGTTLDIWITEALEESEQFRRVTDQIISSVAGPIAPLVRALPGMPLEVILDSSRFPGLRLLSLERLSSDGSRAARSLRVGRFYLPAPFAPLLRRR
jgi:hypothetical protein